MPLAIAAEGFPSIGSHNWLRKSFKVLDSVLDRSGLPDVDCCSLWWMAMVQFIH
jgi:hypothetical protein